MFPYERNVLLNDISFLFFKLKVMEPWKSDNSFIIDTSVVVWRFAKPIKMCIETWVVCLFFINKKLKICVKLNFKVIQFKKKRERERTSGCFVHIQFLRWNRPHVIRVEVRICASCRAMFRIALVINVIVVVYAS